MSPSSSLNLEQQHKLAKDLLRAARGGDKAALARLSAVRADAGDPARPLKLADAQLAIAREAGLTSWPALVAALQDRDVRAFVDAVTHADVQRVRTLLHLDHVRTRVNDPLFPFGQRAAHVAAAHEAMLDALLAAGADVRLQSAWDNGPYTVLDNANDATARFLLARGAVLTPNVAARLGWIDELQALIAREPAAVDVRGGDGRCPLHEAKTVAIVDLLLERGADIDARCVDHRSTPAQYALVERPDVCRRLLERGAMPDIFMPARLGELELARRVLEADPSALSARVNEPGYAPVPPLHIYCWSLGFGQSPHDVALKYGHRDVYDLLVAHSPAAVRFVHAVEAADEAAAVAFVTEQPSLVGTLPRHVHAHLAFAIFFERYAAADLMLRLGFDPAEPGMDRGSALHAACWVGHARLVERILATRRVPVDGRDATHGSTPIGWAVFGSVYRRAAGADYVAVVDRLVAAGADIGAPGNRQGRTLLAMAEGNPEVEAALRRHGAR